MVGALERKSSKAFFPIAALLACLAVGAAMPAANAQDYPAKPVHVIVPHPAGTIADIIARAVTQSLSETLGQPFIVDNRGGAEGIIGAEACSKAAPDGYNLCSTDSLVISGNPVLRSKLPYDPRRDLTPVAHFGFLSSVVIVQPSLPVNSMSELLELAKSKPGAITWGSWGLTSISNMYIEWLKHSKGISFLNVPYKSAMHAAQGVLGGQVQVALWTVGAVKPRMKSGQLKALAVVGDVRSAILPELPTVKEAGIDIDIRSWFGLFAPAGTPPEMVRKLNAAVAKAIRDPAFREKYFNRMGFEPAAPAGGSVEEFAAFLATDRQTYEKVFKTAGVKAE